jgi:hypothetical protein
MQAGCPFQARVNQLGCLGVQMAAGAGRPMIGLLPDSLRPVSEPTVSRSLTACPCLPGRFDTRKQH